MDFLKSLLSRKLLVTVVGAAYFASIGDVNQAMGCILGYLGANAAVDIAKKVKK